MGSGVFYAVHAEMINLAAVKHMTVQVTRVLL
jgi:hypothetical protein